MFKKRYVIITKYPDGGHMHFEFDADSHEVSLMDGKVIVTEEDKCVFYAKEETVLMMHQEQYLLFPQFEIDKKGIKLC